MTQLHYRFPPASAYALNRWLFRLKSDAAARDQYLRDPDVAMQEAGLSNDEQEALRAGDRDALVGLGAHPYLVFMVELRLRMERGTASFEYF